jgi:succinate-acetate transporter protein
MTTIEAPGYLGLVVAALAAFIGLAELCEITYKRTMLPSSRWPSTDRPA